MIVARCGMGTNGGGAEGAIGDRDGECWRTGRAETEITAKGRNVGRGAQSISRPRRAGCRLRMYRIGTFSPLYSRFFDDAALESVPGRDPKAGPETLFRGSRGSPKPRAPPMPHFLPGHPGARQGAFVRQRRRLAGPRGCFPGWRPPEYPVGFRARRCPRVARAKAPLGSRQRRTRCGRGSRTLEDPVSPCV
jgi:hypothetical protein